MKHIKLAVLCMVAMVICLAAAFLAARMGDSFGTVLYLLGATLWAAQAVLLLVRT